MQELTSCFRSSLFVLGCVQETRGQEKENTETGLREKGRREGKGEGEGEKKEGEVGAAVQRTAAAF